MTLAPLEPLPPVTLEGVELVRVRLPLATPLTSAATARVERTVLLVRVLARGVEGWAECVVEPDPVHYPEFVDGAVLVLRQHLIPRLWSTPSADAASAGTLMAEVRGHPMARAALELAILDAQLRAADLSLGSWIGATERAVAPGAALSLHEEPSELLAEAETALAAGATRLRVKVRPGHAAAPLRHLREHVDPSVVLQADANGSFRLEDAAHVAELGELDDLGLACLEQPLAADDLTGLARLARMLRTPVCLDESVTSLASLESAVAMGACGVLCLKPGRVGGWLTARTIVERCDDLGLPVWVGGMLETGLGRAANLAVAGLPGMALPPDLDPRRRYHADLCDPFLPGADGLVTVPAGPGIGVVPDAELVASTLVDRTTHRP